MPTYETERTTETTKVAKVLVIIISGGIGFFLLIMLIGFIVSLNYGSDDLKDRVETQTDLITLRTAVTEYQTNNNNRMPDDGTAKLTSSSSCYGSACDLVEKYLDSSALKNVSGDYYNYAIETLAAGETKKLSEFDNTIYIEKNAECEDSRTAKYVENSLRYAVLYRMEGNAIICED